MTSITLKTLYRVSIATMQHIMMSPCTYTIVGSMLGLIEEETVNVMFEVIQWEKSVYLNNYTSVHVAISYI